MTNKITTAPTPNKVTETVNKLIDDVSTSKLTIKKNGTKIDDYTPNQGEGTTIDIIIPEKTSDLTNDSNFIASSATSVGDMAFPIFYKDGALKVVRRAFSYDRPNNFEVQTVGTWATGNIGFNPSTHYDLIKVIGNVELTINQSLFYDIAPYPTFYGETWAQQFNGTSESDRKIFAHNLIIDMRTAAYTVTFNSSQVTWHNGTAPTISSTGLYIIKFITLDGTNWYAQLTDKY